MTSLQVEALAPIPKIKKRIATRCRILESARTLFNKYGVQGTAVSRISDEIGMSRGNLTYHFPNKSDIVYELSEDLRTKIEQTIQELTPPLKAKEVLLHLESTLHRLWDYRFLFNSAIHVSQMDDILASQVRELQIRLCAILASYFNATIRRGEMRKPRQKDGVLLLVDNITSVWLQWLRTQNIEYPEHSKLDKKALHICMRHHYSLIDPYVGRAFRAETWRLVEQLYGEQ